MRLRNWLKEASFLRSVSCFITIMLDLFSLEHSPRFQLQSDQTVNGNSHVSDKYSYRALTERRVLIYLQFELWICLLWRWKCWISLSIWRNRFIRNIKITSTYCQSVLIWKKRSIRWRWSLSNQRADLICWIIWNAVEKRVLTMIWCRTLSRWSKWGSISIRSYLKNLRICGVL